MASLLSKESHLRHLQRELSLAQASAEQDRNSVTTVEESVRKLEKQLQEKEWDHSDTINARETRLVVPIQTRLTFLTFTNN